MLYGIVRDNSIHVQLSRPTLIVFLALLITTFALAVIIIIYVFFAVFFIIILFRFVSVIPVNFGVP